MQYRKLGATDLMVSYLGFGASALGSVFRATDEDESIEVVKLMIEKGINYIDTAPWYGQGKSERVLGKALHSVPRSSYYIATKVGRYEKEPTKMFDFSYDRTLKSVDESLSRLGLEYVDVVQAHDVEFADSIETVLNETLPALQRVKEEGKARYIGITGYPLNVLKEIVERSTIRIDTVLSYCRYSMNDTTLVDEGYVEFFRTKGIGVINASPLSMGLLSDRGPPDWHPATKYTSNVTECCRKSAEYCKSKGVDISRLALHFSLAQSDCATCLISTASRKNAQRNIDIASEPLSDTENQVLDDVMDKFMRPLNNENWEGYEVQEIKGKVAEGNKGIK